MVMIRAGALIVNDSAALAHPDAPSVPFTLKLKVTPPVGVPEIVPPARFSPAGSDPVATDHVYGGDPPVAFSV
jgi:hypothetical protein